MVSLPAVQVNEAALFATRLGVDWWLAFRRMFDASGRITETTISLGGSMCDVACDSTEDAQWLADQMINVHGFPKRAVKVVRWPNG